MKIARWGWVAAVLFAAGVAILCLRVQGTMTARLPRFWYERARGWHYGPITWRLAMPARPEAAVETLAETPNASLVIGYLPHDRARAGIRFADGTPILWSAEFTYIPGELNQLSASFGSLYPDVGHPYFIKHLYSPLVHSAIAVAWDDRVVLEAFRRLGPIDCAHIHLAEVDPASRRASPGGPGWFSGGILDAKRNTFAILSPR